MPLNCAFAWCCLFPLVAGVGVALVASWLPTELADTVAGAAVILVWLLCQVPAVRSLTARVVADSDGMTVHNALSTVRVAWVDVEGIDVIDFFNAQAFVNALWYGAAVRVRGRRRPVRMLASWVHFEEQAQAFAQRLRSVAVEAGHPLPAPPL
jgi:hypothetical protein